MNDENGIDTDRPDAARIYDYLLGGGHNFAVDREFARRIQASNPAAVDLARTNRALLGRVVRWCSDRGIDQFLDLGSGVPTVGNVHEIAHHADPSARVAYVDVEPVAVAHAREITADLDTVTVTRADLRQVDEVLAAPTVAGLLDLARPVALLAVAVLHFVPGDVAAVLGTYRDALAPGSVLAVTHASADMDDPALTASILDTAEHYRDSATPLLLRDREEILRFFDGFDLVAPGLVQPVHWPVRDPTEVPISGYAGVGVRR